MEWPIGAIIIGLVVGIVIRFNRKRCPHCGKLFKKHLTICPRCNLVVQQKNN